MDRQQKTPGEVMTRTGAQDSSSERKSLHTNSAEAQRARVLRRLRCGPATTIDLRREEDVMMPAARVHELRHKHGLRIDLVWVDAHTEAGRRHRVGLYVLQPGGASANDAQGVAA